MNTHDIGDLVDVSVAIVVDGTAQDPTALTLTVNAPDGTATVYTYGVSSGLIKDSVGHYHIDLSPTMGGRWTYAWTGTGTAKFAEDGAFYVRPRPAFCTVGDLADFLQVTIANEDAAARAIREATAAIKGYCRQDLELVEDDEITLDCNGGTRIFLPQLPVVEVSEVLEEDEELTDGTDYKLGQHGVLHRVGRKWASGVQVIHVTYTHGYAVIPQPIIDVCTRAAARAYQAGLKMDAVGAVPGVQAESLGDHAVTYSPEAAGGDNMLGASAARMLLASEKDALNPYRI